MKAFKTFLMVGAICCMFNGDKLHFGIEKLLWFCMACFLIHFSQSKDEN